jgi:hypothetical protein
MAAAQWHLALPCWHGASRHRAGGAGAGAQAHPDATMMVLYTGTLGLLRPGGRALHHKSLPRHPSPVSSASPCALATNSLPRDTRAHRQAPAGAASLPHWHRAAAASATRQALGGLRPGQASGHVTAAAGGIDCAQGGGRASTSGAWSRAAAAESSSQGLPKMQQQQMQQQQTRGTPSRAM